MKAVHELFRPMSRRQYAESAVVDLKVDALKIADQHLALPAYQQWSRSNRAASPPHVAKSETLRA